MYQTALRIGAGDLHGLFKPGFQPTYATERTQRKALAYVFVKFYVSDARQYASKYATHARFATRGVALF